MKKYVFAFLIFSLHFNLSLKSENFLTQNDSVKSTKSIFSKKLPYQFDDIMLISGINSSGIYYSRNFRNLYNSRGFHIGVEKYFPMDRILFFCAGIHFSQRNFSHLNKNELVFRNTFVDIPVFASFELPEFRDYDFRFIMGYQISARLGSKQVGQYAAEHLSAELFTYNTRDFKNFDNGWTFGLSMEHRNVFVRLRSYMGFTKIDAKEQGMLYSLNLDLGYFIFRPIRKK